MSVVVDSVEKKLTITPQDIDSTDLIMTLSSKLPTVGIVLTRIVLNDTLAWFLNIIHSYSTGKTGQDEIILYSKDPYLVEKDSVNLMGFNGRTQYCNIVLYPLIHSGINKLTVSSDELVMSQYVNGFKTATLAKITINKKHLEMNREITWKPMNFTYPLQKYMDSGSTRYEIPDRVAAHEQTEFPNLLSNAITSFICNGHAYINLFEFVVIENDPSGRALSCV